MENFYEKLERQEMADKAIDEMFDRIDMIDCPSRTRHDFNDKIDEQDFDSEDEYYNEQQVSSLHPAYAGFDDPDAEDDEHLWIE